MEFRHTGLAFGPICTSARTASRRPRKSAAAASFYLALSPRGPVSPSSTNIKASHVRPNALASRRSIANVEPTLVDSLPRTLWRGVRADVYNAKCTTEPCSAACLQSAPFEVMTITLIQHWSRTYHPSNIYVIETDIIRVVFKVQCTLLRHQDAPKSLRRLCPYSYILALVYDVHCVPNVTCLIDCEDTAYVCRDRTPVMCQRQGCLITR